MNLARAIDIYSKSVLPDIKKEDKNDTKIIVALTNSQKQNPATIARDGYQKISVRVTMTTINQITHTC